MDPLTHAASGAVAMLALPQKPATLWALPLAALACASPDLDLLFIHSPLQFLLLHRGISHSFAAMPFFGLLLALCCWPLWRKATPARWSLVQTWLFCMGMLFLHIWLDMFTTYGTMVFLPFSHYRVRLDSLYILDPFISLPLFAALLFWRKKRAINLALCAWLVFYPCAGFAANCLHDSQSRQRLEDEGHSIIATRVLPDVFAPFFWRLLYEEKNTAGNLVCEQSLNWLGKPRDLPQSYPAASRELTQKLSALSIDAQVYFQFAVLPLMVELPEKFLPEKPSASAQFRMFYDLRFGSGLAFMRKLLAMRPNADMPFLLMAEIEAPAQAPPHESPCYTETNVREMRLRFSDSDKDSGWHKPVAPQKPTWLEWLAGLE